jgi:hypothetical protein
LNCSLNGWIAESLTQWLAGPTRTGKMEMALVEMQHLAILHGSNVIREHWENLFDNYVWWSWAREPFMAIC